MCKKCAAKMNIARAGEKYVDNGGDPEFVLIGRRNLTRQFNLAESSAIAPYRNLLKELVGSDNCVFTHHGYCLTHDWNSPKVCPHARAKSLMATDGRR